MASVPLSRPLVLLALAPLVVACTPDDGDDADAGASTGCEASVRTAAGEAEPDRQVDLLDSALVACASYQAFSNQVVQYPGIIGFDVDTFLSLRCDRTDDDQVRATPACDAVTVTETTPPTTTAAEVVYVGDTLDGRRIEIQPSNLIEFDGEIPAVVQQTVDIASESGCPGVIEQRDLWAGRVDDPEIGDEASVFAQHAHNVAIYIKCDPPPFPGDDDETTGDEPADEST